MYTRIFLAPKTTLFPAFSEFFENSYNGELEPFSVVSKNPYVFYMQNAKKIFLGILHIKLSYFLSCIWTKNVVYSFPLKLNICLIKIYYYGKEYF